MTTTGPITGVTKDDLFDEIVDAIDGNGWNILFDGRSPVRIPGADGPDPIFRRTRNPLRTNELDSGSGRVRTTLSQVIWDDANDTMHVIKADAANASDTDTLQIYAYTSSDGGLTYGAPVSLSSTLYNFNRGTGVGSSPSSPVASPRRMADGYFWIIRIQGGGGSTLQMEKSLVPYVEGISMTARTGSGHLNANVGHMDLANHVFSFCPASNKVVYFLPIRQSGVSGSHQINRISLTGTVFETVVTNISTAGTAGTFATAATLGLDALYGVSCIEDKGSYYDVYFEAEVPSVGRRLVRVRETSHNLDSPVWDAGNKVVLTDWMAHTDMLYCFSYALKGDNSIKARFVVDGQPTTNTFQNAETYILQETNSAVAGIPDYHGLNYEYVVFESDYTYNSGNGYKFIMLRQDPNQSSPPTVTGITDKKPIFIRPLRDWTSPQALERFHFDPIIPTGTISGTSDQTGPCLFAVPDITASPVETHKLWVKATQHQVFIFSESTELTGQFLHVNIATPIATPNASATTAEKNDNIVVSGGGAAGGYGCIALGFNGYPEADLVDLRGDDEPYYPPCAELTDSQVLTAENTVDEKVYAYDIVVGSNDAPLSDVAAPGSTFIIGTLYETKYLSASSGMSSGDTLTEGSDTYKFFDVTAVSDDFAGTVVKKIAVKW